MSDPIASDYRSAMRRLTTTVTVVSCEHQGHWFGMTATAVTSVCADPPALLVCINASASIHAPLAASNRFCINLLHVHQQAISTAFSGRLKGSERFAEGDWKLSEDGLPFLKGCQANIFCRTEHVVPFGTHSIFIGAVTRVALMERISPLLYGDGRYKKSMELSRWWTKMKALMPLRASG